MDYKISSEESIDPKSRNLVLEFREYNLQRRTWRVGFEKWQFTKLKIEYQAGEKAYKKGLKKKSS